MFESNEINLIISGWLGSGSTVTSLILAYLLQKKFIYAGATSRFIAQRLGYDTSSESFTKYEKEFGEQFDLIWEKYILWKIQDQKNILVNSKITGFFIDDPAWLFKAYIISDLEVRQDRAEKDNRKEKLQNRESQLEYRWKEIFNIDYKNIEEIRENYDFLIDNTNLTISETVFKIYSALRKALGLQDIFLLSDIQKIETILEKKGKIYLINKLKANELFMDPKSIIDEWKNNFDEVLNQLDPEWVKIVNSI
ncbi:hypothetical protein GF362_00740 [Candidatus Dojkabacteria bacterium]|nr:hypothetical protein [Candidatus Dojkabacteria bacterium]